MTRPPAGWYVASCPAASGSIPPPAPSSTGAASSRSCPTCRPLGCTSRTASSPGCTPPGSRTWWSRHRTRRARRSSRQWVRTPRSRPTSSRSSTPSTRSSSCRTAPIEEAAQLLGSMAPDDAADMISEIDQERRAPILELLPEPQRRKVRSLLHYHPETAGGLMSPDFLELPATTTVEEALDAIGVSTVPREALAVVFVSDPDDGHVFGSVSAVQLIQSPRHVPLSEVATIELGHVHPDWDLGATVRKMSDFNLTVAPRARPRAPSDPRCHHRGRRAGTPPALGLAARLRHDGGRGVTAFRRRRPACGAPR